MQAEISGKQYDSIDLGKFICAVLVVMIHVKPLGRTVSHSLLAYGNFAIQNYLARIAVPFFFVVSGFLLYRKTTCEQFDVAYSKKYVLRLLRLYCIWTVIYFPLAMKDFIKYKKGFMHDCLAYVRNTIFAGSYYHLWYFTALIFAVTLISYLLHKRVAPKKIVAIAFGFYFIGLFAQSWFGFIRPLRDYTPVVWRILKIIKKIIVSTRDGLFDAFFYVSLGMYCAFHPFKMRVKKAFLLFVISLTALGIEIIAFKYAGSIRGYDMFLCLVPTTFFFFCFIVNLKLPASPVYKLLRPLGSMIFYSHLWINWLVTKMLRHINRPLADSCVNFILTILATIVFSLVVIKVSDHKSFHWLKSLYL